MISFVMIILKTLDRGDITYNDIAYSWFYFLATLLIAVNKNTYPMLHLQMFKESHY